MRILGLDVGTKRVGVALSDELLMTAQGLCVIEYEKQMEVFSELAVIFNRRDIAKIVVGLPRNMNGSIGPQAEHVISFKDKLKEQFSVPIILWDERLSTVSAEQTLIASGLSRSRRKQVRDKVAAALILQSYLDNLDETG